MQLIFRQSVRLARDTRGVSLLIAMGLMILLLLVASSAAVVIGQFTRSTAKTEQAAMAYYAAESGVEMGLYELSGFKDGYETDNDGSRRACGAASDPTRTANFGQQCSAANPLRFANLTGAGLSGARGFWQLFSQADRETGSTNYVIPNPYFVGDQDGQLDAPLTSATRLGTGEWGTLHRERILNLSLMIDDQPTLGTAAARYIRLPANRPAKLIFFVDPAEAATWNTGLDGSSQQDIVSWTLSALDTAGTQFSLQGVIRESDFRSDCLADGSTGGSLNCFVLDLETTSAIPTSISGNPLAGQDIFQNITGGITTNAFNRVAGVVQDFRYAAPQKFIQEMNNPASGLVWVDSRLTISILAPLSETSGLASNSLRYKFVSADPVADEKNYIVSEGFSGTVKQTIQASYRRAGVIPIFTFAVFQ